MQRLRVFDEVSVRPLEPINNFEFDEGTPVLEDS